MKELRRCKCRVPEPKPARPQQCVRCGDLLDPTWTSNDSTLAAFLDRFERTFPAYPHTPSYWTDMRLHLEARERAGRRTFRESFHGRDNVKEAREEVCDLALYTFLDGLVQLRAGEEQDVAVAMELMHHASESYRLLNVLRHKRHGAP
jgi:hypothetical protein